VHRLAKTFAIVAMVTLSWTSTSLGHAQVKGGIDEIVRELGFANEMPVAKSVAAMGAMLSVARAKLPEREYLQLVDSLPGTERVITQASNALSGELPTDMAGVAKAYDKLALPPSQATAHRRFVLDYLGKNGGRKIVPLLQKAWKE